MAGIMETEARRCRSTVAICCMLALTALTATVADAAEGKADKGKKEPPPFTPLFNGTDLSGWSGDPELWSVKDGMIVGSTESKKIKKNTFLSTDKTYGDFKLRLKVKIDSGNSGVQFRSEKHDDFVVKGYQADVATATYFGMLYEEGKRGIMPYWKALSADEQKAVFAAAKLDDWNDYEITCRGDKVKMTLNGKVTCEIDDPDGAKSGVIALQLHVGEPMRVYYKDIEIRELKPRKAK